MADAGGNDFILCQITSQVRTDRYSVSIERQDFDQGQLTVSSYARVNRLFTVDQSVIAYTAGRLKAAKMDEIKGRLRDLFT